MFNIGPGELVVILILALVLLGPDRLPEVARAVGKGMKELRKASEDLRQTVEQEIYRADAPPPAQSWASLPPPSLPAPVAAAPAKQAQVVPPAEPKT